MLSFSTSLFLNCIRINQSKSQASASLPPAKSREPANYKASVNLNCASAAAKQGYATMVLRKKCSGKPCAMDGGFEGGSRLLPRGGHGIGFRLQARVLAQHGGEQGEEIS